MLKELKKAFKQNQDIHKLTASQVFGVPINKISERSKKESKGNKLRNIG